MEKASAKKKAVKKVKPPKPPKKKVDKSDPNWKLKPNEKVTVLSKVKRRFRLNVLVSTFYYSVRS